jgi:hypothetical protein
MQKLSLFQRFFSPTPTFELYMQLLFAVIGYIASLVEKAGYISHPVFLVVSGLCAGAMVIAQFAVDHSAEIKAMISDPASAIGLIPEVKELVLQLISAYKTPPPVATLQAVITDAGKVLPDLNNGGYTPVADVNTDPPAGGSGVPEKAAPVVQVLANDLLSKPASIIPEGAAIIKDVVQNL